MTDYPNREHANADKAARRRALAGLRDIIEDAQTLTRRIEGGYEPHGTDAQRLADKAVSIAVNLSTLETLRDAREWHAADKKEMAVPDPRMPPPTHPFAGSNKKRQEVGDPGHCEKCAQVGHVRAHPSKGCGDVGCNSAHGPGDPADAVSP